MCLTCLACWNDGERAEGTLADMAYAVRYAQAEEGPVSPKVREGFPDFISRYSEPDSIGTGFIELQCVDAKDSSGCKVNEWATTVPMVHRCICLQEGHAIIGTDAADNALVNAPPVSSYHNNY